MAKTIDRQALVEWLSEHGPYEVCMMRYCRNKMHEATEQLDYNAHFDAFAMHARLLVDFFTGRSKGDLFATSFVKQYSAPKREHIQSILNKINTQVVHPTTDRSISAADKINRDHCDQIAEWIEDALDQFLRAMSTDAQGWRWNEAKARNDLANKRYTIAGQLSASSADPQVAGVVIGGQPTTTL